MTVLLLAAGPLTRQGAQSAARHELAKTPYQQAQPPWWLRPLQWVLREIARAWDAAAAQTGGAAALSVLLGTLAVLVVLIAWQVGPRARGGRSNQALHLDPETTAGDHRALAARLAEQGLWAEAVRERLRAISRSLEERALVDRRPGRTAYELAADGGRALPGEAADLTEAADRFARIWYGQQQADAEDYRRLTEIDAAVEAARPARALAVP
ncbi:MAG: hypothetical protein QOF82_965 [Frankiales bacterium]|jgi:hypothetical protein|nr:hypothetical protein [Frankiales bacterium]MDX6211878.1 hypothetical protein [Frankiales bacterium]MDX6221064.1 hypothetical protein [Frankiales bacterium]